MKANITLSSFDKSKFSFNSKSKYSLSEINQNNFRDTISVFTFNKNDGENIRKEINVKLKDKSEYEFPNRKTMAKELIKKIFTKDSGEIINKIKKVNEEMKSIQNSNERKNESLIFTMNNNGNQFFIKKEIY